MMKRESASGQRFETSTAVAADTEAGPLLAASGASMGASTPPPPRRRDVLGLPSTLVAGACYCVASGSMVLLNKKALSSYAFSAPNALLFFQCALAAALVKACELAGLVRPLQPLRRELVRVWFPVNLIFVGMIGSSFYALASVGVGMVTVWKNVSNFVTAVCDVTIYGKRYSGRVWGCLGLMLLSAVAGAATDIRFSWEGYGWQARAAADAPPTRSLAPSAASPRLLPGFCPAPPPCTPSPRRAGPLRGSGSAAVSFFLLSARAHAAPSAPPPPLQNTEQLANCGFTSAYALYLRSVMDKAVEHTVGRTRMDESSMVLYNNLLSLPPLFVLMYAFGELDTLWAQPALYDPAFLSVACLGGLIGFGISYSALWFLSETTATYYSLVGALNKIPVALVGIFVFLEPTNSNNLLSIAIGLGAGVLFVFAKQPAR